MSDTILSLGLNLEILLISLYPLYTIMRKQYPRTASGILLGVVQALFLVLYNTSSRLVRPC